MTPPTRLILELTSHPSEAVLTVLRMGEQLRNERLGDCRSGTVAGREPIPRGLGPSGDHQLSQEGNRG